MMAVVDNGTTDTILNELEYFTGPISKNTGTVTTITGTEQKLFQGSGSATVVINDKLVIQIESAKYAPSATRNLVAERDIRKNGFDIFTSTTGEMTISNGDKPVLVIESSKNGLFHVNTHGIKGASYFVDTKANYEIWHARLGHLGPYSIKRMITKGCVMNLPIKAHDIPDDAAMNCHACHISKVSQKQFDATTDQQLGIMERLDIDIKGPLEVTVDGYRYALNVVDYRSRKGFMTLLKSRSQAFAAILFTIFKMQTYHSNSRIKIIRIDNAGEFRSAEFQHYCQAMGITVQYTVPYTPQMNGIAEAYNKKVARVARTLLLSSNLSKEYWGHAMLHANTLVQYWPHTYLHYTSPYEVYYGEKPDIGHIKVFGTLVEVALPKKDRSGMKRQRKAGIYVGFTSPSIIEYIDLGTGNNQTARYKDCWFQEMVFPMIKQAPRELQRNWDPEVASGADEFDVNVANALVNRALQLRAISNLQPLAVTIGRSDRTKDTLTDAIATMQQRSNQRESIGGARGQGETQTLPSVPNRLSNELRKRKAVVTEHKETDSPASSIKARTSLRLANKRREKESQPLDTGTTTDDDSDNENSNQYYSSIPGYDDSMMRIVKRGKYTLQKVNTGTVNSGIEPENETAEGEAEVLYSELIDQGDPKSIEECQESADWPRWKEALLSELQSLQKREVFTGPMELPMGRNAIGHRWVLVKKKDANGEVVRYKARLVAQGFSQRPGHDYTATYSPVMDLVTFRLLLGFSKFMGFHMDGMDVVTAYLYGQLKEEIYMTLPKGVRVPLDLRQPVLKVVKSLYGLKQAGRQWYHHYAQSLLQNGYQTSLVNPCVFYKKTPKGRVITSIYVDDSNVFGDYAAKEDAKRQLKAEFEMKDLGALTNCIGIQIEHLPQGVFIHQTGYIVRLLEKYSMANSNPRQTPMEVRNVRNDELYGPTIESESLFEDITQYKSAIGSLSYLAISTRPEISFAVNLLARYSVKPAQRHWQGIKKILRYLNGTKDLGLLYTGNNFEIVGFADAGYQSDPKSAKSQTGYVFTIGGTAFCWRSVKQTVLATSTTHAELIALYQGAKEIVWIRRFIQDLLSGLEISKELPPTILYEDNQPCMNQIQTGYIRSNMTKHISPELVNYTVERVENKEVEVRSIASTDNVADILTKSLPAPRFMDLRWQLGLRSLAALKGHNTSH